MDSEFFKHLSKFHNITDDEIEEMATGKCGLDAEECLMLHLERDFVRSFNDCLIESLKNLK